MKNNNNNKEEKKLEGKEMSEKKMTLVDLKTAMSVATLANDNTDSMIACDYLDDMKGMDKAFAEYNKQLLIECYDTMNSPADVMKRGHFSPLYSQYDKKNKCYKAVSRSTRLNVLDFINEKKIDSTLPEKIQTFTVKLAEFIASEIQYDGGKKTVNIKTVVPFLQDIVNVIGIDGIIARNRDVRFIAYKVTGGSSTIGKLNTIDANKIALALIDVYTVQLSGGQYDFEKKNDTEKA